MELCWIDHVWVPAAPPAGLSLFLNRQGKKIRRKSSCRDKGMEAITNCCHGQKRFYLRKNYFNLLSVKRELDSEKQTSLLDHQFLILPPPHDWHRKMDNGGCDQSIISCLCCSFFKIFSCSHVNRTSHGLQSSRINPLLHGLFLQGTSCYHLPTRQKNAIYTRKNKNKTIETWIYCIFPIAVLTSSVWPLDTGNFQLLWITKSNPFITSYFCSYC